jgi:hypothetical protein
MSWNRIRKRVKGKPEPELYKDKKRELKELGFMKKNNKLESYIFECTINSEIIIACIDKFSEKLEKETVLVMDNASIHQNN